VTGQGRPVLPLPGPLDVDPTGEVANLVTARKMLCSALDGVPQGAHDRLIVGRLAGRDISTIATVASLLRRSFEGGLAAGRTERVDEIPVITDLQEQVTLLTQARDAARDEADDASAEVKTLARQLDAARATVERVNGWWRDAQTERAEAREEAERLEADLQTARADCAKVGEEREHLRADIAGLVTTAEVLRDEADQLRAEVAAADRERDTLTRILAAAVDIEARFDAEQVSAQGAFERLLTVITDAGGVR
jgi:chromosome segregation ATPase